MKWWSYITAIAIVNEKVPMNLPPAFLAGLIGFNRDHVPTTHLTAHVKDVERDGVRLG